MNAREAEELFKRTRRKFRRWAAAKCSGYVHGVRDGLAAAKPHPTEIGYINDIIREGEEAPNYAIGYLYGFVDAYGSDIAVRRWYRRVTKALDCDHLKSEYRWWV